MSKTTFKLAAGTKAGYYNVDDEQWYDVNVLKVGKTKVTFTYVDYPEEGELEDDAKYFDEPLEASVQDKFDYYGKVAELALKQRLKSLVILGQPGLGKSYTLDSLINAMDVPVTEVRGHCTPLKLYETLYENQGGIIVFDDCDSVLQDHTSGNILKAVLDTTGKRVVSWKSAYTEKNGLPTEFEFWGTVIFVSNLPQDKLDRAVISRSVLIDLYMTVEEMVDRMNMLLPSIDSPLKIADRKKVMEIIDKYKTNIPELSVRTLKLALDTYEATDDLRLVRYQLLCRKAD